jgi:hypothetical protein
MQVDVSADIFRSRTGGSQGKCTCSFGSNCKITLFSILRKRQTLQFEQLNATVKAILGNYICQYRRVDDSYLNNNAFLGNFCS